jgi:hypothetical protein
MAALVPKEAGEGVLRLRRPLDGCQRGPVALSLATEDG